MTNKKEPKPKKSTNMSYAFTDTVSNEIPKITQMLTNATSCFDMANASCLQKSVTNVSTITSSMTNSLNKVGYAAGTIGLDLRELVIAVHMVKIRGLLEDLIKESECTTGAQPKPEEVHCFQAGVSCLQAALVSVQPLARLGAKRLAKEITVNDDSASKPLVNEIPEHEIRD
ncbi:hypothetical protein [Vibrio phage CAU_VPP01]|nr:hypothetical protein [Vibrio phage CAU_VPP01]